MKRQRFAGVHREIDVPDHRIVLAKPDAEPFNVNAAPFGDLKVAILMDGNQHGQGDQKRRYILQDI